MSAPFTSWKFFGGACILVAGLLIKSGAPLVPIAVGLVLAGVVTGKLRHRANRLHH
jgi:hypothetical protein